jgi:hypothetical protein
MNVVGAIKDLWLIQNAVGFVSIIEMAHNGLQVGDSATYHKL